MNKKNFLKFVLKFFLIDAIYKSEYRIISKILSKPTYRTTESHMERKKKFCRGGDSFYSSTKN